MKGPTRFTVAAPPTQPLPSSTSTCAPPRAAAMPAQIPAGPAPTTSTSVTALTDSSRENLIFSMLLSPSMINMVNRRGSLCGLPRAILSSMVYLVS